MSAEEAVVNQTQGDAQMAEPVHVPEAPAAEAPKAEAPKEEAPKAEVKAEEQREHQPEHQQHQQQDSPAGAAQTTTAQTPAGQVAAASEPDIPEQQIFVEVEKIMRATSLDQLSLKKIRESLSAHFGRDMTHYKTIIKETVDKLLEQLANEKKSTEPAPAPPAASKRASKGESKSKSRKAAEEDEEEAPSSRRQSKKPATSKASAAGGRKSKAAPASSSGKTKKTMWLSESLAAFMGVKQDFSDIKEISKKILEYVKEHNLHAQDKKGVFVPDATLATIFPRHKFVKTFPGTIVKLLKATKQISYWQM